MKNVNEESMRYRVPGAANNFWQVHARFILICLTAAVMAITVVLSFFTIRKVQTLFAKPLFLFFCTVDDPAATEKALHKYDITLDIYLVRYNDTFRRPEEDGSSRLYDFSSLGEEVEDSYMSSYSWGLDTTAAVYINESGTANVITFEDLTNQSVLEEAKSMTITEIERTIRLAKEKKL